MLLNVSPVSIIYADLADFTLCATPCNASGVARGRANGLQARGGRVTPLLARCMQILLVTCTPSAVFTSGILFPPRASERLVPAAVAARASVLCSLLATICSAYALRTSAGSARAERESWCPGLAVHLRGQSTPHAIKALASTSYSFIRLKLLWEEWRWLWW